MRLLPSLATLAVGVILGQLSIREAYNPRNLEIQALNFVGESHFAGCKSAGGADPLCIAASTEYIKTVESIWKNKAWSKNGKD